MLRNLSDDPMAWPGDRVVGGWPTQRDRLADPGAAVAQSATDGTGRHRPAVEHAVRHRIPVVEARDPGLVEQLPAEQTEAEPEQDEPVIERRKLREALAELEHAKRRVEGDAQRVQRQARAELVEKLLPVMDNLDLSLAAAEQSADTGGAGLSSGLRLVREQFEQVLQGFGLERFDSEGQRFDPNLHEAVSTIDVPSPSQDGRVVRQWQAGYRFEDRILRAAKVQVGKMCGR